MEPLAEFLDAAREEFDEAFDWYAKRSHGAAIGFATAVDAAIDSVLAAPERFPRTYAECQYCRFQRYPYSLIYHRSGRRLTIIDIAHAKRRAGYWRRRA